MRRRHVHGIASVVAGSVVLLAVGVRAQDVTGPAGFRATAEIVQFDALFLDGEGRPVTDIRKEEVRVRQGGTPVPLRDLRFQPRPAAVAPPAASTAATASPPASSFKASTAQASAAVEVEPWIFLIDDLAMSPDAFDRMKVGLRMLFEQELPAGVEVGLLRTGDLGNPKTRLTADRAALQRAVSEMRYKVNRWRGGVVSRSGAHGAGSGRGDRVFLEGTLGSLNSLVVNLRALPRRKVIVLLSEYLTLRANDPDVQPGAPGSPGGVLDDLRYNDVGGRLRRLGHVAAASGVTVHAVNVLGVVSINGGGRAELNEGLHAVADELGGVYLRASNDVQDLLARLMTVEQGYYMLAYVPPDGTFDDRARTRFVPVSVSVSRPGVTVRTRQGFFTR
jgi:VWFA-related protein